MDIALMIHRLRPEADWQGSVTENTRESFEAIRWVDRRGKPSWTDLESEWTAYQAEEATKEPELTTEERMDAMENRLGELEFEAGR